MTALLPPLALAQAAVARLCHDLAGAVGTIGNALELAAGGGDLAAEALAVAAEASRELTLRLRMARLLWGDETASVAAVLALADGLPARTRLRLDRTGLNEAMLQPPQARLLAALLLLAAESLHGAGAIVFAGDPAREISVSIDGPRAAWPTELGNPPEPGAVPDAAGLVPYLAVLFAAAANVELVLADKGTQAGALLARRIA